MQCLEGRKTMKAFSSFRVSCYMCLNIGSIVSGPTVHIAGMETNGFCRVIFPTQTIEDQIPQNQINVHPTPQLYLP